MREWDTWMWPSLEWTSLRTHPSKQITARDLENIHPTRNSCRNSFMCEMALKLHQYYFTYWWRGLFVVAFNFRFLTDWRHIVENYEHQYSPVPNNSSPPHSLIFGFFVGPLLSLRPSTPGLPIFPDFVLQIFQSFLKRIALFAKLLAV